MKRFIKWLMLLVPAAAFAAWRTVELAIFTEANTGFYALGNDWLWTVCVLCLLLAVVLGFVFRKMEPRAPLDLPKKGWLLPLAAYAVALACVYEGSGVLWAQGFGARAVCIFLAAVFFLCCGVFYKQSRAMPILARFFALPLAVWHLLAEFLNTKGMAITAEHVYRLFMYGFALITYVALAKVLCRVELQKSSRRLLCWSIPLAVVAVGFTLPAYLLALFCGMGAIHGGSLPSLADLLMGVFPLLYGLTLFWSKSEPEAAEPVFEAEASELPPQA